MRISSILLAELILLVPACTVQGKQGPSGDSALTRTIAEPSGGHCANGGVRIETGLDKNGNHSLDDKEVTGTSYVCNGAPGPTGATGAAGPKSNYQLVAKDGFVYGRTTGLNGWLWNDTFQGFFYAPIAVVGGTDDMLTGPPGLRIWFISDVCVPGDALYLRTSELGPSLLLKRMLVPLPQRDSAGNADLTQPWNLYPGSTLVPIVPSNAPQLNAYMDFPDTTCHQKTLSSGATDLLAFSFPGSPDTVPGLHPGPAELQPVTVP